MRDLIVADTSPLQYLLLSDSIHILPRLVRTVIIPAAVLREAQHPKAPEALRIWIQQPPEWLKVETTDPFRWKNALGSGESEAIALALTHRPDILLVDDREARLAALELGIQTMGTLGILGLAAQKGLLVFSETIAKLKKTNMHLPDRLIEQIEAALRKK